MQILSALGWPDAAGPGHTHTGFSNLASTLAALPLAPVAQLFAAWLATRPCGSTLAGVGQCPLAIGHGCLVGLLADVLDRRPVSPLSSTSCSGAGSGWHCRNQIADCTVFLGGPATGGVDPLLCANSWAVTVIVWQIASVARLRWSRGHWAERGQSVRLGATVDALSAKLASSSCRPTRGPVVRGSATTPAHHPNRPVARSPLTLLSGQWPAHVRQNFADSDAGPDAGSHGDYDQRLGHGPIPRPVLAHA